MNGFKVTHYIFSIAIGDNSGGGVTRTTGRDALGLVAKGTHFQLTRNCSNISGREICVGSVKAACGGVPFLKLRSDIASGAEGGVPSMDAI
jgi:hypothetical protein